MKRSTSVKLVLMGTAVFMLGACGQSGVDGKYYVDVSACKADPAMTADLCDTAWAEAKLQHKSAAPTFETRAACEQEFGEKACRMTAQAETRNRVYVPGMAGYFIARAMMDGRSGSGVRSVYYAKNGFYGADGSKMNVKGSKVSLGTTSSLAGRPKSPQIRTAATVARSGGFGSSARASSGG